MGGDLWSITTVLGPIILAAVIAYLLLTRRKLSETQRREQHDAVEDLYNGGDGGKDAPPTSTPLKPEKDG